MKERMKRLQKKLTEEELDAVLITNPENRYYLTGFTGTAGAILLTTERGFLITDFRYTEQAGNQTEEFEIIELNKDIIESINDILQEDGTKKLGIEAKTVNYYQYGKYEEKFKDIKRIT